MYIPKKIIEKKNEKPNHFTIHNTKEGAYFLNINDKWDNKQIWVQKSKNVRDFCNLCFVIS